MNIQKLARTFTFLIICFAFGFAGCHQISEEQLRPLGGLEWFSGIETVKQQLSGLELLGERETGENAARQNLLDYTGAQLLEFPCDLTVCFTSQGLVGLNYHDISQERSYSLWMEKLEAIYGIPTENGSGMASWYDNPVGKNTALYLFNLEEEVQISFYAVSSTPDQNYQKQEEKIFIPAPELRSPIVPAVPAPEPETEAPDSEAETQNSETQTETVWQTERIRLHQEESEPAPEEENPEMPELPEETEAPPPEEESGTAVSSAVQTADSTASASASSSATTTTTAAVSGTAKTETSSTSAAQATTRTETVVQTETEQDDRNFRQQGLQFYAAPESERRKMSQYTQLYEYRTEEPGQPWELIMEYQDVPYCGRSCNAVLCFTSRGLVGINYFDIDASAYDFWIKSVTELYSSPSVTASDYAVWENDPAGTGTVIYVFALEDGIQISFFADDTGSELA